MSSDDDILLSDEVAAILRMSPDTLAQWRHRGQGPAWFRLNLRKPAYRRRAVNAWIDRMERESAEKQASEHRQAAG